MGIKRSWQEAFGNVAAQGSAPPFTNPVSPSGRFLAFVSKVEELDDQGTVFVMLDMMTQEWASNASSTIQDVSARAPLAPSTLFSIDQVALTAVAGVLGVTDTDYVAEGAWYSVTLAQAASGADALTGDLIDGVTNQPLGSYTLTAGRLLLLPAPQADFTVRLEPPPASALAATVGLPPVTTAILGILRRLGAWFFPPAPVPVPPPPIPPTQARAGAQADGGGPAIVSIGVMDVGAGGCNLLFTATPNANPPTLEPFVYFDLGRPIPVWVRTEPTNLLPTAPAPSGPIMQNATATLGGVLSHWDYDHWMLASVANLGTLPWLVCVQQPYGPSANQMTANLPNSTNFPPRLTALAAPGGEYTLFVVTPRTNAKSEVMNNSGIVMLVPMVFPTANAATAVHHCLLPADASLGNIHPTMPQNDLSVYGAVHHGAATFGAPQNIPGPVVPQGAVVFSYGIRPTTLAHGFRHPTQASITANQNAGWMRQFATAETQVVSGAMPEFNGMRGNVLVGQQWSLAAAYRNTAFFTMTHAVT